MNHDKNHCESCGMTIESGPYCHYCVDENGKPQAFEERFERMIQFARRRDPSLDDAAAERSTLDYLATMPAWRDHPRVKNR